MAGEVNADAPQDGGGFMSGSLFKMMMFYFLATQLAKQAKPSTPKAASVNVDTVPTGPPKRFMNAWKRHQSFDLHVYISEAEEFDVFDDAALVWHETGLTYALDDEQSTRQRNVSLTAPPSLKRNESYMWAHVFLSQAGTSPDPNSRSYDRQGTLVAHHPLVRLIPSKKVKATKNLLSGEYKDELSAKAAEEQDSSTPAELVPHWKPALTISAVEDFTTYQEGAVPPQIQSSLQLLPESSTYLPVLFINEFWLLSEHLVAVNETINELPLELTFSITTMMRWLLTAQMQASMEAQAGLHGKDTSDELKRMLTETSPVLLGVTVFVSVLHMLFDFLAFKNDISFWKNNKSMKGLSLGSMLMNLFFQGVIFLYLCDNETSWMIVTSTGVGLVIEVWKLRKAVKSVQIDTPAGSRIPRLRIIPADSYALSATKVHDEEAMRYLSLVIYPLVVGYSLYSLANETHKSWYSWLLGSIVGCVYSFGFIMMTPQLFINYKLKSTAHMPWKTFMYKALNTFVDDLFAFVIRMPTMHRLSCLRDDLIFLVYLYQRWQYGVDTKRPNEFGQVEGQGEVAAIEQTGESRS